MFSDIEKKLKTLASAMAVFGILAAIAGGVLMYRACGDTALAIYNGSFTAMIAGGFALFFGSFFAYGLGQLIENTAHGTAVVSAPSAQTVSAVPTATATAPSAPAAEDEAAVVAIATAAIAASRGASACAFKVISITKIS